ncbi:MAG: peroxidase-related enzyme [Methanobacteriota archaeon]|nr:MAG: peroxidase-related enzyme [Euryarchaeota archaeon]
MAWIETKEPATATGRTKEVFERIEKERGHIANVFRAEGAEPDVLSHQVDMYVRLMMGPGPLSRKEREMIAVVVSAANTCAYGAVHHAEALESVENDQGALTRLLQEYMSKHESPRSKALLAYSAKLTLNPKNVTKDDVDDLREAGLNDEEILRANLIAAYFNLSNRISLGLGVEIERDKTRTYRY